MEPGWGRFIVLSILLHLGVLSLLLFVPDPASMRKLGRPTVYEVDLVSLPAAKPSASAKAVQSKRAIQSERAAKKVTRSKKAVAAKRISTPKMKKKPVIIGKRTV
jgi:hypothetical protein